MRSSSHILALIRNVRAPQFFFLYAAFCLGGGIAAYAADISFWLLITQFFIPALISAPCIWLLWLASTCSNDAYDIETDRISNPHRPLVHGIFTPRQFLIYAHSANIAAIVLALTLSPLAALWCGVFMVINYLYNTPPRLKRYPLISTILGASAVYALILMGFASMQYAAGLSDAYPFSLAQSTLAIILIALIIPLKDIKDIAGDRAQNVHTLPTLLGARPTATIALISASVTSLLPFLFTHTLSFVAGIYSISSVLCAATIIYYAVYHKKFTKQKTLGWLLVPTGLYLTFIIVYFF